MATPFAWQDFLILAEQLQASPTPSEAALRTSIGRAYYALFCTAKEIAVKNGLAITGNPEDHGRVVAHFARGKLHGVGEALKELREWRNCSDYDLTPRDFQQMAVASLRRARRALQMLQI